LLIAKELHFAEYFKDKPLIYPTLFKSATFAVIWAAGSRHRVVSRQVVQPGHFRPWRGHPERNSRHDGDSGGPADSLLSVPRAGRRLKQSQMSESVLQLPAFTRSILLSST